MTKKIFIIILTFCAISVHAQEGMNRPYVDDKLFHMGFQLGLNFASFGVIDSEIQMRNPTTQEMDTLHARVSGLLPGFHVGFIADLRLCRYLNLRFTPGLQFSSRTLNYKWASGNPVEGSAGRGSTIDILSLPINLPLYLKWSAAREGNYRPYVIAGGGVSINVSRDKEKPVLLNLMDYFCEVGFGCDFYFSWFKFCPEITYRIGFGNQLCPADQHPMFSSQTPSQNPDIIYTNGISRLTNHCICITFNFE